MIEVVGPEVDAFLAAHKEELEALPPAPRSFYFKDDPNRPERSTRGLADRYFEGDVPYMRDTVHTLPEQCLGDFFSSYCVDAGPRADRKYKVVFYGMSGYTGSLIMEYLKRECKEEGLVGQVAFAGRTLKKVIAVRDRILRGTKWANADCIQCNLNNPFDVEGLVSSTCVVANIAGPFMLTGGERLVEACIHYDTDYCDVSGEVPYSAKLLEYHDAAWDKGVYIVPSSAYAGGMPDIGAYVVARKIRELYSEETRSIRGYVQAFSKGYIAPSGGTLQTRAAMSAGEAWVREVMQDPFALGGRIDSGVREEDQDKPLTRVFKDPVVNKWLCPHVYAFFETRVVRRSNWLHNQVVGGPEAGDWYGCAFNFTIHHMAASEQEAKASKAGATSVKAEEEKLKAAGKYYGAGEGPPMDELIEAQQSIVYHFVGISESGKRVNVSFKGRDAYYETARVCCEMALAMAFDSPKLRTGKGSVRGGVLTPAIAGRGILPERLRRSGMGFIDWTESGEIPDIKADHTIWDMPPPFEPDVENE